jgi:hypothetical protein
LSIEAVRRRLSQILRNGGSPIEAAAAFFARADEQTWSRQHRWRRTRFLPERMRPVSDRGLANCRNAGAAVRFADAAASAQLLCDEA